MKIFSFLSLFLLFLGACTSKNQHTTFDKKMDVSQVEKRVDVYIFHGTRQCTTCKNMKAFTRSTLDRYFKNELNSGLLTYQIIDVDDSKNEKLAEKFQATGTALMVNNIEKGKEEIEDWSDFAFEFASGDQKEYEETLQKMLTQKLN